MGGFGAAGILGVLDLGNIRDVLVHLSAQGNRQSLYAPTYAQYGNLAVVGQPRDQQFRQVALSIDAPQPW